MGHVAHDIHLLRHGLVLQLAGTVVPAMREDRPVHPSEIGRRRPSPKPALHPSRPRQADPVNIFQTINDTALSQIRPLAERWLTTTRMSGDNLMAINPTRADKKIGSFSINIRTGKWADFATGDKGGDIISFYAYLHGIRQIEAAFELADILGVRV